MHMDKNLFVKTQLTLLQRLGDDESCQYNDDWARFFDLYYPAMVKFVEIRNRKDVSEDIAQRVFVKLVKIFREGRYQRQPGKSFHGYLMTLLRNELVDLDRYENARGEGLTVAIGEETVTLPEDVGARLDVRWRLARHQAAVEHVLTQTPVSEKHKAIYTAYVLEERPIDEVAAKFGVSKNDVSQIKTRIGRRVKAIEDLLLGVKS